MTDWTYLTGYPPTYRSPSGVEAVLAACHPVTGPEWRLRMRPGAPLSARHWATLEDAQAAARGEASLAAELERLAAETRGRLARQERRRQASPTARMLAILADGEARSTAELARAVGLPANSASALLCRLIPRRQVERLGRGVWRARAA